MRGRTSVFCVWPALLHRRHTDDDVMAARLDCSCSAREGRRQLPCGGWFALICLPGAWLGLCFCCVIPRICSMTFPAHVWPFPGPVRRVNRRAPGLPRRPSPGQWRVRQPLWKSPRPCGWYNISPIAGWAGKSGCGRQGLKIHSQRGPAWGPCWARQGQARACPPRSEAAGCHGRSLALHRLGAHVWCWQQPRLHAAHRGPPAPPPPFPGASGQGKGVAGCTPGSVRMPRRSRRRQPLPVVYLPGALLWGAKSGQTCQQPSGATGSHSEPPAAGTCGWYGGHGCGAAHGLYGMWLCSVA